MNPHVYLHEFVKTPSGREDAYSASVVSMRWNPARASRSHWALGQYKSAGIAGSWPWVINIWEHTWESQTKALRNQFADSGRDTALETWWNRNLHLRSGGYDRLLLPAAYSPDRTAIRPKFLQWKVYLQEIAWLPLGEPRNYLDRLQGMLPAMDRFGIELAGAFEVAMRPNQVLTLLAANDWNAMAGWMKSMNGEASLAEWRRYREATITRSDEHLLLPVRHDPTGPRQKD